MVLRYISVDTPRLDQLGLPDTLRELAMLKRGLVLMVGATGSGKSTTLAAMINHRNENSSDHILTIEDPVEFLHQNRKAIVNQREVGLDTRSFSRALRAAMRAAPDVILIGEIRDRETMESAIALAGTGHLAIATLHANNSAETLDRIINLFPRDQHAQIFLDLSQYLRAIVSQRLVRGRNNKRVAAVEVMLNTPHIQDLIKKGDVIARQGSDAVVERARHPELRLGAPAPLQGGQDRHRGSAQQRRLAHQPRGAHQLRLSLSRWRGSRRRDPSLAPELYALARGLPRRARPRRRRGRRAREPAGPRASECPFFRASEAVPPAKSRAG